MPTINPDLVPTITPGSLFDRFTTDPNINIRWLVPSDPAFWGVLNRPIADTVVRQLILAKTIDSVNLRLGHQALFPFVTQPQINNGTQNIDLPSSWVWDMHASMPTKWEKLRLSKVKRLSGKNGTETNPDWTGIIKLVFTAQEQGTTLETAVFQVNYRIDSTLTYQEGLRLGVPSAAEESPALNPSESETVGGFVTFRTLDTSLADVQAFLEVVSPPDNPDETDSNGFFLNPVEVELNDSAPGGSDVTGDFNFSAISHGTGLLTLSAFNAIPAVDSTVLTWISTFNYPFDSDATLLDSSGAGIVIPKGLFKEFDLTAPSSDEPTGDVSGEFFPVYVSRIERLDVSSDSLKFFFATYNIESPSIVPIEFATLTLNRTDSSGLIASISPEENLFQSKTGQSSWMQGFGKGHVVLSDLWTISPTVITDFFDSFIPIIDDPAQAIFAKSSTRISSFGLSRVPQYVPTAGQSAALKGTKDGITDPGAANRYVVEGDQGLGEQIDLAAELGENPDIERFGFTGSLTHKAIKLVVNSSGEDHDYETDILPRLKLLLGRSPLFYDVWYDGSRFKYFDGDKWIAP